MSPNSALTVGYTQPCCHAISQQWDGTHWASAPPRTGVGSNLIGVDSLSHTDAWAVGRHSVAGVPGAHTLTEHWDGFRWRVVDSGAKFYEQRSLSDVTMITSRNVWAAGTEDIGEGAARPVILHWDGTTWTTLESPTDEGSLNTIDAVSSDDIWTTGPYSGMLHWDGTAWTEFPMALYDRRALSAVSSDDVWVVARGTGTQRFGHWDGESWTPVSSAKVGMRAEIVDITALSKNDAWAVGHTHAHRRTDTPKRALIEHWDGREWDVVRCPHPGEAYDELTAVDARSPDDVWAVGTLSDVSRDQGHRFTLHWDGSTWTQYHA